jgi:hypothetical protein
VLARLVVHWLVLAVFGLVDAVLGPILRLLTVVSTVLGWLLRPR